MKRFLLGKLPSMIGLLLVFVAPMLVCTNTCFPPAPRATPERQIPLEELLMDETVFPAGWRGGEPGIAPLRIGERLVATFHPPTNVGLALHDVYRCRSAEAAATAYEDNIDSYFFSPREGRTSWSMPPELSYESTVADQFRLGCRTHIEHGSERCQAVGQYDEYVVHFAADMSSVMTYDDLEHILQAIDERMAHYLGKEAQSMS
jgi:hypothetical protein